VRRVTHFIDHHFKLGPKFLRIRGADIGLLMQSPPHVNYIDSLALR